MGHCIGLLVPLEKGQGDYPHFGSAELLGWHHQSSVFQSCQLEFGWGVKATKKRVDCAERLPSDMCYCQQPGIWARHQPMGREPASSLAQSLSCMCQRQETQQREESTRQLCTVVVSYSSL